MAGPFLRSVGSLSLMRQVGTTQSLKSPCCSVTTNRYEVWGPDADQSFIAPAHTLLEAKAAIDADLMR